MLVGAGQYLDLNNCQYSVEVCFWYVSHSFFRHVGQSLVVFFRPRSSKSGKGTAWFPSSASHRHPVARMQRSSGSFPENSVPHGPLPRERYGTGSAQKS